MLFDIHNNAPRILCCNPPSNNRRVYWQVCLILIARKTEQNQKELEYCVWSKPQYRPATYFCYFVQANHQVLEDLVPLTENIDVAETVTRLLGADDDAPPDLRLKHIAWISNSNMLEKLLQQ